MENYEYKIIVLNTIIKLQENLLKSDCTIEEKHKFMNIIDKTKRQMYKNS